MNSVLRNFIGFCSGILTTIVLSMLTVNIFPYLISEYLPIFVGAFITAFIIRNKPVVVGGILSILMMGVSILNLMFISFSTAKSVNITGLNSQIIISLFLYLPFGLLGGK